MRGSRNWNGWGLPLATAVVAASLAWAAALDPRWLEALDYRRDAIAGGQAWRLITAHVVHLSAEHAVLDIAGLMLVAWIFAAEIGCRLQALLCVVAIVFVDVALWALRIDRYAGLSGVLHAWFATGAVCWLLSERTDDRALRKRAWGAVLCIGLCIKLILELREHAFWLDGMGLPVVTAAHRWGAAAGVVCGVCATVLRRRGADGAGRGSRSR